MLAKPVHSVPGQVARVAAAPFAAVEFPLIDLWG